MEDSCILGMKICADVLEQPVEDIATPHVTVIDATLG